MSAANIRRKREVHWSRRCHDLERRKEEEEEEEEEEEGAHSHLSSSPKFHTFHIMSARCHQPTFLIALFIYMMSDAIFDTDVEGPVASGHGADDGTWADDDGPVAGSGNDDGQVAGPIEIDSNGDDDDDVELEVVQDTRFPTEPRVASTVSWFLLEIFSPPRVAPVFERISGGTGVSVDVTTGWDANDFSDRAAIWTWMEQNVVEVLIASPPCTMFSTLMASNRRRMSPAEYRRRAAEAVGFWRFVIDLCRLQQSRGRGFIIEHPVNATSWSDSYLQNLWAAALCN